MKKRSIITFLCIIMMLVQNIAIVPYAEEMPENTTLEQLPLDTPEKKLFEAIGLIPEQMTLMDGAIITRGEFAYLTAALSGYAGGNVTGVFSDVNEEQYFAPAIEYLYSLGVVSGFGSEFRPDDGIIFDEAVAMAVKAVGYKDVLSVYGEYPSNVRVLSQKEDFFEKLAGCSYTDKVTTGDALVFLSNVANTETVEPNILNTASDNGYERGETLLYKHHDIITANGKMTDNGITSITGESGVSAEGAVIGGESVYIKAELNFIRDYIGEMLDFWYVEDSYELVYAIIDEKHNDTLTLTYDRIDITELTVTSLPYFSENGGRKKIAKISPFASVIYNGKAFPGFGVADLAISSGSMVLIDENRDNVYDTVKINEYEEYVVAATNAANQQIFAEGLTITVEDFDNVFIKDLTGSAKELTDLTMDTPIMVSMSKDGKSVVTITECKTLSVRGAASQFIPDGENTYIVIGTETYKYSNSFERKLAEGKIKAPEFDTEYNFYRNINGDVFGYTVAKKSADWYTGYAIAMHVGEIDGEPSIMGRIKMQDSSLLKLNFCKKIEINGVRKDVEDCVDIPELFDNSTGRSKRQPIQFKLNEWGEISAIKTAKDITAEEYPYDEDEFSLDLYYPDGATFKGEYVMAIQGVYMVTGSTLIIKDPYLGSLVPNYDDKEVIYMTSGELYSLSDLPNCYVYDLDKNSNVGTLVFKGDTGSSEWKDNMFLVDKAYEALDEEGMPVKRIDGIILGEAKSYEPYNDKVSFSEFERGDVCRVKIQNDKILDIEKIMSLKEPGEASYVLDNGIENSLVSYTYAPVLSVNKAGVTVIAPEAPSGGTGGTKYKVFGNSFNNNKTKVAVYDVPNDTVKVGSISSIYANVVPDSKGEAVVTDTTTRIFLYRRWGYLNEAIFVIY